MFKLVDDTLQHLLIFKIDWQVVIYHKEAPKVDVLLCGFHYQAWVSIATS
jgi:hypothetical protein